MFFIILGHSATRYSRMAKSVGKEIEEAARAMLKDLLRKIRDLMKEQYHLKNVSIKPIGGEGSRLSIPCRIVGTRDDERVPYFAKIMGPSDFLSSLSIQFLKNIYLSMNSKHPLFDSPTSAEEMARFQYETLKKMKGVRIPTPKPFGYHSIDDLRWLLVAEFIDAKSLSIAKVDLNHMDSAFHYLKRLHNEKIFHGDIKPDNIMIGDKLYIVDIGRFRKGTPKKQMRAYDVLCMICSFLNNFDLDVIVDTARGYNPPRVLKDGIDYISLVQRRPDFYYTDETASRLRRVLKK